PGILFGFTPECCSASARNPVRLAPECCSACPGIRLHPSVAALWRQILNDIDLTKVHLKDDLPAPTAPPDPDEWHRWYVEIIGTIEHGRDLPPLSRHFAEHE